MSHQIQMIRFGLGKKQTVKRILMLLADSCPGESVFSQKML